MSGTASTSKDTAPRRHASALAQLLALAVLAALLARPDWFAPLFARFAENGAPAVYHRASLLSLTTSHLAIVAISSLAGTLIALAAGIFVTRPASAEFLPVTRSIVNIGQTFPPVALLALAVPAVGFGVRPVLIALVLYGLLPVFESTLAGLDSIPAATLEAARGMGMNGRQRLWSVELPLAFPVILTGIRLSVVINLGTATIGSTVAAQGLGDVIVAGLQTSNLAFVLQGGLIVALLAIVVHAGLGYAGRAIAPEPAATAPA
ncbi:MAG: ABC transporter permease [Burkholderia sp.]